MILLAGILVASMLDAGRPPAAIGFESTPLKPADIQIVEQLAHQQGLRVWFLRPNALTSPGSDKPMTWHIEAYLEPRTSTPCLRRGEVVIFYKDQTLASAGSSTWRRSPTVENYAEVTRIGKVLQQGLTRPSSLATFFDAPDSINDDDLVAILDVVRTPLSTTQLDRLEHTSVRARCEQESAATRVIMQVAPASDGRIEVSFLGGCYYHLARRESTWVVVEVGTIVS